MAARLLSEKLPEEIMRVQAAMSVSAGAPCPPQLSAAAARPPPINDVRIANATAITAKRRVQAKARAWRLLRRNGGRGRTVSGPLQEFRWKSRSGTSALPMNAVILGEMRRT